MSADSSSRGADAVGHIVVRPLARADVDAVVAGWHRTNRETYTYVAEHQRHTLEDARAFLSIT